MKRTIVMFFALATAACLPQGCSRGGEEEKPQPAASETGGSGTTVSVSAAPEAAVEEEEAEPEDPYAKMPLGLDPYQRKIPEDNPITPAKVELGRHLYFDPRLSRDDTISCASCHDPDKGWSNGERFATGVGGKQGNRNSPTVINRVFGTLQFWDGRAASLEEQALGPIQNPIEMAMTLEEVVEKLSKIEGYKPLFKAAFGDERITPDRIAKAIASFERTIVSGNSPFDRYQAGDKSALTESQRRGMEIFFDNKKGRCSICHAGINFTDEKFHNLGVGWDKPEAERDLGRYLVTKEEKDKGAFKTPTLRNVAETAPYMHDGSEATLEDVIEFYNKGGIREGNPYIDPEMKPLNLTAEEKKDLVEFLKALTGEVTKVEKPELLQ